MELNSIILIIKTQNYETLITLKLFAGDINVVAALGDGIIEGKGALADNLADMTIKYRGVSFATGKVDFESL